MIAFVGKKDELLPFKVLGIDVFFIENQTDLEKIDMKDYRIIFVSEEFFKFSELKLTGKIVVPLPGKENIGLKRIAKFAEKAIGVNIFK